MGLGLICWLLNTIKNSPVTSEKKCLVTTYIILWPFMTIFLSILGSFQIWMQFWKVFVRYCFCKVQHGLWKTEEEEELNPSPCGRSCSRVCLIMIYPLLCLLYIFFAIYFGLAVGFLLPLYVYIPYFLIVGFVVFIKKLCTIDDIWLTIDDNP